jgi:hypothetical protein
MGSDREEQDVVGNIIEEKYRNLKLELQCTAYAVRKSYLELSTVNRQIFSNKYYRLFITKACNQRTTFTKEVLKSLSRKSLNRDEYEVCDEFLDKVYSVKLKSIRSDAAKITVETLIELYEMRQYYGFFQDSIYNADTATSKEIKAKMRSLLSTQLSNSTEKEGDYLEGYENRREKIIEFQNNPDQLIGVPIGIKKFDKLSGGIQRGELCILLGQSGTGKSVSLGNFAMNQYLNGYDVIYFTLEMTKIQVEYRLDSRIAQVLFNRFRRAELTKKDFAKWKKEIRELRATMKNKFHVVELSRGANTNLLEDKINRAQDKYKRTFRSCYVDYINLMSTNKESRGTNKGWESQADVAYDLAGLAKDFNEEGMSVFSPNQVADVFDRNKEKLELKHMKYARGIGEVAQVVLGISQTDEQYLMNQMSLQIAKCRDFGKMDPITLYPDFDFMTLSDEKDVRN